MDPISNPLYRNDYIEGYSIGLNPYLQIAPPVLKKSDAFSSGFTYGRLEYERLNGPLVFGVPLKIVTDKVLEEFLLAGMLGMGIDADGYTAHQMNILQQWYQSGIEKYDPNESLYLLAFLEHHGIETL